MIEINLLPKEFLKKGLSASFEKNFLYALGGAVALLLVMAGFSVYQNHNLGVIEQEIDAARAKVEAHSAEIAQIGELNDLKEEIKSRISAIKKLDLNRSYWVDIYSDFATRIPAHVWLTEFKEAGAGGKQKRDRVGGEEVEDSKSRTTLEGYAFSLSSLAAFMIQLNKSPYFRSIRTSSIRLEEAEGKAMYSFTITCKLNSPARLKKNIS